MYDFELPLESSDFTELGTHQVAHSVSMFSTETRNIVHRPLRRELDSAVSTIHIDEPERTSVYIDAGKQIFPQFGRVLQKFRQLWRSSVPGIPARATSYSGRYFSSKKITLPPLVLETKYPPLFRRESLWGFERPEITSLVSPLFRSIT